MTELGSQVRGADVGPETTDDQVAPEPTRSRTRSYARHLSEAGEPGRRRLPPVLWVITGLWAALLLCASILWPPGYGFDEFQHIDMAYSYANQPLHFYGPGERAMSTGVHNAELSRLVQPLTSRFGSRTVPARSDRPSFAALGGNRPTVGGQPNQMVQHPPLYYEYEALVLRIPGVSSLPWDLQVWLMRLFSGLLLLPIPALCWAGARRLLAWKSPSSSAGTVLAEEGRGRFSASRLAVLAAVVPLTIPDMIRNGASVTNDSLVILAITVVLYALCRVVTGDFSKRTATIVAISLAAGLLTKGTALILPPVILAGYLLGRYRTAVAWRRLVPPLAIAAVGGIVGGLWWLRNVIDYGALQPDGFGPGYDAVLYGPRTAPGKLWNFIPQFLSDLLRRVWGQTGYPDLPDPGPLLTYGAVAFLLVGVAGAVCIRRQRLDRTFAVLLVLVPVAIVAVVALGSWAMYQKWSQVPRASQGRYVYPGILSLAVVTTLGWLSIVQRQLRPRLAVIGYVFAVLLNLIVWTLIVLDWYVSASSGSNPFRRLLSGVHVVIAWSPLPAVVTVLFFAACLVVAIWGLVAIVNNARAEGSTRRDEIPPGDGGSWPDPDTPRRDLGFTVAGGQ